MAPSSLIFQRRKAKVSHRPSFVPSNYVERYWRDWVALGGVSLASAQTDDGIAADRGEMKPAGFFFREQASVGGPFSKVGLPGYGYDVQVDPFAPGLPAEYLLARPLGEIEFIPGAGVRHYTRASTGSDMTALMASQFGDVNGAAAAGAALHCSALTSTYRKVEAAPPCAFVTYGYLRQDGSDKAFTALHWTWEAGNHAYPNDTLVPHLETDSQESLEDGTGAHGSRSSVQGTGGGFSVWDTGDVRNKRIGIGSLWLADRIQFYGNIDGGAWTLIRENLVSGLPTGVYAQKHVAFIHDMAWGYPWEGSSGKPSLATLAMDVAAIGMFVEPTNTNYTAPAIAPPSVCPVAIKSTYLSGAAENLAVGTALADIALAPGVAALNVITAYPSRVAAVITSPSTAELRVAGIGLDFATQPTLTFAIEGVKPTGEKLVGPIYSITVTDVGGYPAPWWNANALIEVDYVNGRAYIAGTGAVAVSAVHDLSTRALTAASISALDVSAYVMLWEGSGGDLVNHGLFGDDQDRFLYYWHGGDSPPNSDVIIGAGADNLANIGGYTGSNIAAAMRAVASVGTGGSKIAIGLSNAASCPVAADASKPTQAFTGGYFWGSGYGDEAWPGAKTRLLVIAPQYAGGSAGAVLTTGQIQAAVQSGI
ncbi:hypothetical protein [Phenylobacterium sp.]|jgi:hypothetical protein|uniref:hypothetical protein n=1 Tax=Phenylobacterium sp. TaxID=1871053 RepID=UPI002F3F4F02